jgi:hypothetical protein
VEMRLHPVQHSMYHYSRSWFCLFGTKLYNCSRCYHTLRARNENSLQKRLIRCRLDDALHITPASFYCSIQQAPTNGGCNPLLSRLKLSTAPTFRNRTPRPHRMVCP